MASSTATAPSGGRQIVVAVDGSACSYYSVKKAALLFRLGAEDHLVLLHVARVSKSLLDRAPHRHPDDVGLVAVSDLAPLPKSVEHGARALNRAERLFRRTSCTRVDSPMPADHVHKQIVPTDSVREGLVHYVERHRPHALVVGTRGLGAVKV